MNCATCQSCGCTGTRMSSSSRCSRTPGGSMTSTTPLEARPLVDIVRFLGSIDLVARQRSWEKDRDTLFDRFFEGYRQGLVDPRLSASSSRHRRSAARPGASDTARRFSRGARRKMEPMADVTMKAVVAAIEAFAPVMLRERPEFAPGYFRVVRAGWLQMRSRQRREPENHGPRPGAVRRSCRR